MRVCYPGIAFHVSVPGKCDRGFQRPNCGRGARAWPRSGGATMVPNQGCNHVGLTLVSVPGCANLLGDICPGITLGLAGVPGTLYQLRLRLTRTIASRVPSVLAVVPGPVRRHLLCTLGPGRNGVPTRVRPWANLVMPVSRRTLPRHQPTSRQCSARYRAV